jgi:hypothetical protein
MKPKQRLTYQAQGPYGRPPVTDLERFVVDEVGTEAGCCQSVIERPEGGELVCTRNPHNDGRHFACGTHRDIIATWEEELLQ